MSHDSGSPLTNIINIGVNTRGHGGSHKNFAEGAIRYRAPNNVTATKKNGKNWQVCSFLVYRVAQNKIPHRRICNISATNGLILKILEAA